MTLMETGEKIRRLSQGQVYHLLLITIKPMGSIIRVLIQVSDFDTKKTKQIYPLLHKYIFL